MAAKPTLGQRLDDLVVRLNRISDYLAANPPKAPMSSAPPVLELVVDNTRKAA